MRILKVAAAVLLAVILAGAIATQAATAWIEHRVPRDGERTKIGGTALHYVDRGEGPPIVMIHGLMGQVRNFAPALVDRLTQSHRVVLVDRPGAGYSDPLPSDENTIAAQADLIAELIKQLELVEPVVVGHSLGGAVALALALDHPERVGALALIAPAARPKREASSAFGAVGIQSDLVRRALSLSLATPFGLVVFEHSAEAIFAPEPITHDFATTGGGLLSLRPASYFAAGGDLKALRQALPGVVERYATLDVPTHILFGKDDPIVDPEWNGAFLRDSVPNATLTEIEGGHMIVFTKPEAVAEWLLDAARSGSSPPGSVASRSLDGTRGSSIREVVARTGLIPH